MPEDANGGVRINQAEIYRVLLEVRDDVAELRSDFKAHLQLAAHPQAATDITDHESRLRKLEAWRYAIPPAIILAVGSLAVAILEGFRR